MILNKQNIHKILDSDDNSVRNSLLNDRDLDEFDTDVIDGILNSDVTLDDFEKLDKRYAKSKRKIGLFRWYFTGVILFIGIIYSLFFLNSEDNSGPLKSKTFPSKPQNTENSNSQSTSDSNDERENLQEKQTDKNEFKNLQKSTIDFQAKPNDTLNQNTWNEIQSSTIRINTLQIKQIDNGKNELIVGQQGKEVYILSYITLDYREYRKGNNFDNDPLKLTNGLPANLNVKNSQPEENEWTKLNYFDFLTESMRYFDKKMFQLALDNFQLILTSYPDDINALFYGALCKKELKKYHEAIINFEDVSHNKFSNFNEESQWNILLCLIELGDLEQANSIKRQIIDKNGFYAKRASELKF